MPDIDLNYYPTTMPKKELQTILLQTNGWMFYRGRVCIIKSKHIGAGIYKVWLQEDK